MVRNTDRKRLRGRTSSRWVDQWPAFSIFDVVVRDALDRNRRRQIIRSRIEQEVVSMTGWLMSSRECQEQSFIQLPSLFLFSGVGSLVQCLHLWRFCAVSGSISASFRFFWTVVNQITGGRESGVKRLDLRESEGQYGIPYTCTRSTRTGRFNLTGEQC